MGRPRKELNWEVLDSILKFGAKLMDCSDHLGISEDTIQDRIKEKYGITFTEYRERKLSYLRISLLKKQFDVAMQGNTSMLIWLGKQYLCQTDKEESKIITDPINITIDTQDEKL